MTSEQLAAARAGAAGAAPGAAGVAPGSSGEAPGLAGDGWRGRAAGWIAAAGIIATLAIMVAAGLLHRSWMPPRLVMPAVGPPFQLAINVAPGTVVVVLWVTVVVATGAVAAGLYAVRRGQPVPVKTILVAAAIAIAMLAVVPPVGSTDALDYAIYGHIVAIGRSPYSFTPAQYQQLLHLTAGVPGDWLHDPSYYGPLATAEEFAAAKLAGSSLAVTAFWLKLVNALAFAGVALLADRLLRRDRAARLRAHLLWTANPLLIWSVVAAGHVDMLAAAAGVAGLLMADRWVPAATGNRAAILRAAAAGLAVGAAVAIKADYLLFALALALALRRRPWQLLAAAGGAALIVAPGYLVLGPAALRALAGRASTGLGNGFYSFFLNLPGLRLSYAVPIAVGLTIPVAWLALSRLPACWSRDRAIRAGLALSVAWLLLWPHQFAWYSVMIICVLIFFPRSRLDWLALAWLGTITFADLPGLGINTGRIKLSLQVRDFERLNVARLAPAVMLVALIGLVALCLSGRWRRSGQPTGADELLAAAGTE